MRVVERLGPALVLQVTEHHDERGWFSEAYTDAAFATATGLQIQWTQDSRFFSVAGALRGPHAYPTELGQYKLVECLVGMVFELLVCVDPGSEHRGRTWSTTLTGADGYSLLVPPGVAHATLALRPSVVQYKTNVGHRPDAQIALAWDDPELVDLWPSPPTVVAAGPTKTLRGVIGGA